MVLNMTQAHHCVGTTAGEGLLLLWVFHSARGPPIPRFKGIFGVSVRGLYGQHALTMLVLFLKLAWLALSDTQYF